MGHHRILDREQKTLVEGEGWNMDGVDLAHKGAWNGMARTWQTTQLVKGRDKETMPAQLECR